MKRLLPLLASSLVLLGSCSAQSGGKALFADIDTSAGSIRVKLYESLTPKTVENFVGLAQGTKEWLDPRSGQKVKRPFYDGLTFHRVIPDFMIQGGCPVGNGTGGPGYAFADETWSEKEITGKIVDAGMAQQVWDRVLVPHMRQVRGNSPSKLISSIYQQMVAANSVAPLVGQDIETLKKEAGVSAPIFGIRHPVAYGTLCMANSGPDSNGSQFFVVTKKGGCPWLDGKHTVFGEVVEGMEVAEKIQNVAKDASDRPLKPVTILGVKIFRK